MKRALMVVAIASGGLVGSCQRENASRLTVDRDTLVLYGPRVTPLPVRLSDRTGASVSAGRAEVTVEDSALLRVTARGVSCLGVGTTRVHIQYLSHEHELPTACRPARLFRGEPVLSLIVGDAPAPLAFVAIMDSGEEESVHPVAVTTDDSSVARIEGEAVRPVTHGRTTLRVELGGATTSVQVSVSERVGFDSVPFVPRAFGQWALAPGRYSVTVRRSDKRVGPLGFEVITDGAKCQRNVRDEDTVYCTVTDTGSVSLYSAAADSQGAAEQAWITIYRLP